MTPSGDSGGFLTSWSPPLPSVTRTGAPLSKRTSPTPPFFFFQAEDGIRYADVTGVQTCALPISEHFRTEINSRTGHRHFGPIVIPRTNKRALRHGQLGKGAQDGGGITVGPTAPEIGRASCRERV